jgi:hypothetical protein
MWIKLEQGNGEMHILENGHHLMPKTASKKEQCTV